MQIAEKVYDHVNWDFLIYMLVDAGFWQYGGVRCIVFWHIVYNLDFLVDFWRVRGLCQCDPLSLMLFVIVMEALSIVMDTAVRCIYLSGFTVGNLENNLLMISHYLFVGNTLIFSEVDSNLILLKELPFQVGSNKLENLSWYYICYFLGDSFWPFTFFPFCNAL